VRLRVRGAADVRCRTLLTGDRNSGNDLGTGSVYVRVTDAATVAILSPPAMLDYGDTTALEARFANWGTEAAVVRSYFHVEYGAGTVACFDSLDLALEPLADTLVTFDTLRGLEYIGQWRIRAWCSLDADQRPDNDTLHQTLVVAPPGGYQWPAGWREVESLPRGGPRKPVKAGGALAVMTRGPEPVIYALKGNKTDEFYQYDLRADTWTTLKVVPPGPSSRLPYTGAALATDNRQYVYMVKGNSTCEFWRYDVDDSVWTRQDDVPPGPGRTKVKGGDDLVYVERNDSGYVYLLKGLRKEFYRFNVRRDTWETLDSMPTGTVLKWNKGSFLVHDGGQNIYALQAKSGQMWRYGLDSCAWVRSETLSPMPLVNQLQRRKKPGEGAAGAWFENGFYALKGGSTVEFWRYTAGRDSWAEQETLRSVGHTGRKKLVKAGGDLVYAAYACWAFKGNATTEFWRYGFPLGAGADGAPARSGVAAATGAPAPDWRFDIVPNPLSGAGVLRFAVPRPVLLSVRLCDALGRVVAAPALGHPIAGTGSLPLDLERLPAGLYLARVSCGRAAPARTFKLVVR
jgi:hypothetical protein